jgi:hypothetical protein
MLSSALLDKIIDTVFITPQRQLSARESQSQSRAENISVIAVRFDSNEPSDDATMLFDPVTLRIAFKCDSALDDADQETLDELFKEIKSRDEQIGGWTLLYDVRSPNKDKKSHPTWRLATEVRPSFLNGASILDTPNGRFLCLDVTGAAVFVGRQKSPD